MMSSPSAAIDSSVGDRRPAGIEAHRATTVRESSSGASLVQEADSLVHERLAVLEETAMPRVRVETQPGVWQPLEQGVGVEGWHHDVVLAVHDEHRLRDLL